VRQDLRLVGVYRVADLVRCVSASVSFIYLRPGEPQRIEQVTGWPGNNGGDDKTRTNSAFFYDEAHLPALWTAMDQDDQPVLHFKSLMRPLNAPPKYGIKAYRLSGVLPEGKTIQDIYSDFLRLLLAYAKAFFQGSVKDGRSVWIDLYGSMEFIIAVPSTWGLDERLILLNASVQGGLVNSLASAQKRVHFMNEAEASIHFMSQYSPKFRKSFWGKVRFYFAASPPC
jgi:hypothetical protein